MSDSELFKNTSGYGSNRIPYQYVFTKRINKIKTVIARLSFFDETSFNNFQELLESYLLQGKKKAVDYLLNLDKRHYKNKIDEKLLKQINGEKANITVCYCEEGIEKNNEGPSEIIIFDENTQTPNE